MQPNDCSIYIILSRSKTLLARLIQLVTRQKYNHSSLALDASCSVFYSFGRRNPRLMFPAGFIVEGVDSGFFALHPDVPAAVYRLPVTPEQMALIRQRLAPFLAQPKKYKYSVLNLLTQQFGIAWARPTKYVCSAFIATLLEGILDTGKPATLVFPHDFQHLGLELVYEGTVGAYTAFYTQNIAPTCEEENP